MALLYYSMIENKPINHCMHAKGLKMNHSVLSRRILPMWEIDSTKKSTYLILTLFLTANKLQIKHGCTFMALYEME